MSGYRNKPSNYFTHARTDISAALPPATSRPLRALEIGCAEGFTLDWLKTTGVCDWVAGIEPYATINSDLKTIDHFEKIDIELQMPNLPKESVDLILCLDVLEHLRDPWKVLQNLDFFLKRGGHWIISVPNVRNYRVVLDLLIKGNFEYKDAGIMDRTHLRFFTRKTLVDMIQTTGARVDKTIDPETKHRQKKVLETLGLGELLAKQWLLAATKM
jgi:2-polyprenyl-3-methyl-5-hydroxy-6-metoxy-1,4-benzoquinol methylase